MTDKVEVEVKEADKVDFEKRYNDSQTHISKIEAENASFRTETQKDKDLIDGMSPFVDWSALNGVKPSETTSNGDDLVDKATLDKTIEELRSQINRNSITQDFRSKYSDMVQYEDLVGVYLQKTDTRRPMEERIEKAVESTRKFLESERATGRDSFETEKKEKAAKEAEAAGLSNGKGPLVDKDVTGGETYDEYIASRKDMSAKTQGII